MRMDAMKKVEADALGGLAVAQQKVIEAQNKWLEVGDEEIAEVMKEIAEIESYIREVDKSLLAATSREESVGTELQNLSDRVREGKRKVEEASDKLKASVLDGSNADIIEKLGKAANSATNQLLVLKRRAVVLEVSLEKIEAEKAKLEEWQSQLATSKGTMEDWIKVVKSTREKLGRGSSTAQTQTLSSSEILLGELLEHPTSLIQKSQRLRGFIPKSAEKTQAEWKWDVVVSAKVVLGLTTYVGLWLYGGTIFGGGLELGKTALSGALNLGTQGASIIAGVGKSGTASIIYGLSTTGAFIGGMGSAAIHSVKGLASSGVNSSRALVSGGLTACYGWGETALQLVGALGSHFANESAMKASALEGMLSDLAPSSISFSPSAAKDAAMAYLDSTKFLTYVARTANFTTPSL